MVVYIRKMILLLLCLVMLAACAPLGIYQRTCDDIAATNLRPLLGTELRPDQLRQWIIEVYDLSADELHTGG
ncbi:MAG: hypothetical protein QGH20_05280, partial [Candidatus Latescibacteria bacterium]|nr:hypothetical protein [Candidatus Latescibacterota bacterium]